MSYRTRASKPTAVLWLLIAALDVAVLSGASLAAAATAVLVGSGTWWAVRRARMNSLPPREFARRTR